MPADLNKVLPSHLRMEIEPLLKYPVKAYTIKCCYTKREATLTITFDMLHKNKWETTYGETQDVSSGPATTHGNQKDVKNVSRDEDTETGTEIQNLTTDSETSYQSDSRRPNVQRKTVIQERPQECDKHDVGERTELLWKIVDRKFNRKRKRSKKRCRNNRIKTNHPQPSTQLIHNQPSKCPDQTDSHLCPGVDVSDTPPSTCPNVSDNEMSPDLDVPHKEPTQDHGMSELQSSQHPEVTCNEPSQDLDLTRSGNIEQNKVRSFNDDKHMKHIYNQPISRPGVLDPGMPERTTSLDVSQAALTPATKVQDNQQSQHPDVLDNQPSQHPDVLDNQPSQRPDVPDKQPSQRPDVPDKQPSQQRPHVPGNQPSQHPDVPDKQPSQQRPHVPGNQPSQHPDVPDKQPSLDSDVPDKQPSQHPDLPGNQPRQHPDVPDKQPSLDSDVPDKQPSLDSDVPDNQPSQHPDVPVNQPSQQPDVPDNQPSQHPGVPDNLPSHPQRRCTRKLDNNGSLKRKSHEMNVIKESDENEDTEKCGWSPGEYLNSPKYRQVARRHLSDHPPHHIQGYDRVSLSPHYPVFTMVIQTGSHINYTRIPTAKDLAAFFSIWRRKYNFNEGFVSQASLRFLLSTDATFSRAEQPLLYQLLRGRVPFMNKRSKLDFLDKY